MSLSSRIYDCRDVLTEDIPNHDHGVWRSEWFTWKIIMEKYRAINCKEVSSNQQVKVVSIVSTPPLILLHFST